MKFERNRKFEAITRSKVEGWVGEIWSCRMLGFTYVLNFVPKDNIWAASYKRGGDKSVFLGTRHHAAMPELPSFDTRTEAERACEAQHKINRSKLNG